MTTSKCILDNNQYLNKVVVKENNFTNGGFKGIFENGGFSQPYSEAFLMVDLISLLMEVLKHLLNLLILMKIKKKIIIINLIIL
ncbi:hypothetical protein Mgra_00004952 [Meloidogyne graminicola]|uniref:Uncharacterized protein n=1 Tax=Meloidogyne graminicola TaxID=189291 RepID=A0A8S9ZQ30_9BILA|nr:hypothetical protein Mgra_00004952 [Meloidogyne graminicola]